MREQYQREENMLHRIMIVLIAIAAIGVIAIPTDVSARGGHGGYRGGSYGGYRGGYGYRGYGYIAPVYGYSCWRWVATPVGPRRVWACGYGYPYY
jgi:hypothetical protein